MHASQEPGAGVQDCRSPEGCVGVQPQGLENSASLLPVGQCQDQAGLQTQERSISSLSKQELRCEKSGGQGPCCQN